MCLHRVPPSPEVLSMLFMDYQRLGRPEGLTFRQYLHVVGYSDKAAHQTGMDDNVTLRPVRGGGIELIDIPAQRVTGRLRVMVLLVDFQDRVATFPKRRYEDLLFSRGVLPTGSMYDYFSEVSCGQVQVEGEVHGWLRMPRSYAYYTNGESGTGEGSYPRNAQRMAEDAVRAACEEGLTFTRDLDTLGQGTVTALFIVHAGRGAEVLPPALRRGEIWSHKWVMQRPVDVGNGLLASTYLTVPEDCRLGVCAHELGHLAFQWQDFYDPNYDRDGEYWDGAGRWDLMAGGSYNGGGSRPAHPAGLHKLQHGWIHVVDIDRSTRDVTLPPPTGSQVTVARVRSPVFRRSQYLLLENRRRVGFDFDLPGEGLLAWRVDEVGVMESAKGAGMALIEADGRHDLENPSDWNEGDAGDPFPGSSGTIRLEDEGVISTSFAGHGRSGITLDRIRLGPSGEITFDVDIQKPGLVRPPAHGEPPAASH